MTNKITAPNGDRFTVASYLGWVRLNQAPCRNGHVGCAGWKNGPCSDELQPRTLKLESAMSEPIDHLAQMVHMSVEGLCFHLKALGGAEYFPRLAKVVELIDRDSPEARKLFADVATLHALAIELDALAERLILAKKPAAKSVRRSRRRDAQRLVAAE